MASIFTKIINGDIPCYKVAEDDKHFAFLDINPLTEGHTLVVPKIEVDYIFDLEDTVLAELNIFAKKVALGIEKVIKCKRVGLLVIGTEVPHAHVHLLPFKDEAVFDITRERIQMEKERFSALAEKISAAFIEL